MRALNCIVVDDEPLALGLIKSYILKTPYLNMEGAFSNSIQALERIKKGDIDIAFLDIQMPDLNGIELAAIIPETTFIVFITAYDQYALEGFKVQAVDYLLKPADYSDFLSSCEKVAKRVKACEHKAYTPLVQHKENIFIKADYKTIAVKLQDILYVEGLRDYVKFYLDPKGESYSSASVTPYCIMSLQNMKDLESFLPNPPFIRIHRSFIVNLDKINSIERQRVVFGKEYLPISDSYKDNFEKAVKSRTP